MAGPRGLVASLLLVASACVGPATQPRRAEGESETASGKIAFVNDRDGDYEIYLIDARGGQPRQLTRNRLDDIQPAWSPDGGRIAFVRGLEGRRPGSSYNSEIYVIESDGSHVRRLTRDRAGDATPAWSPDGSMIVFGRFPAGSSFGGEVYVMNADGSRLRRLTRTPSPWGSGEPAWSPDGTRIVFVSDRDRGNADVYVMDADGTNVRRLTRAPADEGNASWSPDGEWIAFTWSRFDPRVQALYLIRPDGTDRTRLTGRGQTASDPSWSPDGSWIAFVGNPDREVPGDLYVLGVREPIVWSRLTDDRFGDSQPTWGP